MSGLELGVLLTAYVLIIALIAVNELFLSRPVGSFLVVLMMPFWFLIALRPRRRDKE